jgi:GDP-4-dehydro-6-deoxy-D-mannose reductase
LVKRLVAEGVEHIFGADLAAAPGDPEGLSAYHQIDISDDAQVRHVLQVSCPDTVFHLAGTHQGSSQAIYDVNVLGTVRLLENLRQISPRSRLLVVGSAAEYGDVPSQAIPITEAQSCRPIGPYGISKYAATMAGLDYARAWGLKVAVVRPFNIVGAGISASLVVGALLARIRIALETGVESPEVPIGNLDTERDFIAVDDVVDAYVRVIHAGCWGEIFNICSGTPRSVRHVLETLLSYSTRTVRLRVEPSLIRNSDVRTSYGSFEKARRAFGFVPRTDVDTALREAWNDAMGPHR